jgi:hypothetical protein
MRGQAELRGGDMFKFLTLATLLATAAPSYAADTVTAEMNQFVMDANQSLAEKRENFDEVSSYIKKYANRPSHAAFQIFEIKVNRWTEVTADDFAITLVDSQGHTYKSTRGFEAARTVYDDFYYELPTCIKPASEWMEAYRTDWNLPFTDPTYQERIEIDLSNQFTSRRSYLNTIELPLVEGFRAGYITISTNMDLESMPFRNSFGLGFLADRVKLVISNYYDPTQKSATREPKIEVIVDEPREFISFGVVNVTRAPSVPLTSMVDEYVQRLKNIKVCPASN